MSDDRLTRGRSGTQTLPAADHPDPRRWYALVLLCAASFMVILDAQIVIVAVPSIEADLHVSAGASQWILAGYGLTFGGLLLLGGRAADYLGRRRMFMVGVGLFVVSSLLCGLAGSGDTLITARVAQGVSAAIMAPSALSILMTTFADGPERNKALGASGGVAGLGGTAGALLGGTLADGPGWEWIFFLNVPIGLAMLVLSPVLLRESRTERRQRSVDLAGAVTVTAALGLLLYAVTRVPAHGWTDRTTVAALVAAIVLVPLFVIIETRTTDPLVPLRIFRSGTLVGGNVLMLAAGMAAWGQGFILTQYAQQVLGYSAVRWGLATVVLPATAVIASFAGQHLVTRVGFRLVAATSMVLILLACLTWTRISVGGSYVGDLLLGLVLFGTGLGAGTVAASIAALTGVAERESGLASGLNNTAFQIGGAFGIAVLAAVASARTLHTPGSAESPSGLVAGYHAAFVGAALFAVVGLLVAVTLLHRRTHSR